MKTKLFTQNACFVMLMTFMLVLSVQGIADAAHLPLTKVSGDLQTKPEGNPFEISFTVGVRSNTTPIYNAQRQLIDDGTAWADRVAPVAPVTDRKIDTQGYQVEQAGNRLLRLTTVSSATSLTNIPADHPVVQEQQTGGTYATYTAAVMADTGRNAYNTDGMRLYFYRAPVPGVDANSDGDFNDAGDTLPVTESRLPATITQAEFSPVVPTDNRYHYNQESIMIATTGTSPAGMTFKLKAAGFQPAITSPRTITEDPATEPNAIPRSITLICTPVAGAAGVGTYTIAITDATAITDTPWSAAPPGGRANIGFTLYVTDTTAGTITATGGTTRVRTVAERLKIDDRFTVGAATNRIIHYQVANGSGTLYVGTLAEEFTTPDQDLATHQSSAVYLKTNGTTNHVIATLEGDSAGATVIFEYTGRGGGGGQPPPPPTITPRLAILTSGTGATRSVTVTATNAQGANVPGLPVTLSGTALTAARSVVTGTPATITPPSAPGTYTLQAIAPGYTVGTGSITVAAASQPATLTITAAGGRSGTQQAIRVTATPTPSSAVVVTLSGVANPTTLTIPADQSSVTRVATLLSASAAQTLTVSATNYRTGSVTIAAATQAPTPQQPTPQQPTPQQPTPQQPTVSEPDRIIVGGSATRSGTVNEALEAPLLARVLDAGGNGVPDVTVIFRVTAGRGRLSQRGAGNAVGERTDSQGYARASGFIPLSAGKITIEAEVRGVTQKAVFTITTDLAPATIEPGTEAPTPSTTVSPVVNPSVGAASRPPMLWVSGGKIYALVGSDVEVFISNVENATNLTVGGGKVYWTAKTSDTHGTLNSANLDGTQAKQLRTVWGVPRGITVDPTGSKLYWVDAAGRLQRSDLDGSDIQNVLRNLSEPKDVALSGGNAYWIGDGSGTDTLSFINLSDPKKEIHPIAATSGTYGGLTIAGRKLYWTEQVSDTHGTLNSANLDGTGAKELRDDPIWGAPIGIAVDTARSRLYWTDAVGRLQRSNLDGSRIQNVAKGLGRLGDIVLSNSIAEPAQTPSTKPTPTASKSKYDLNGDGVVDNTDAGLVSEALNTTNAKYDVNDDGVVNFLDLLLVFDNRDAGAAGAPPLLGMKLTAAQIGIIEEQIELLIATGDRSPAAMRTLIYLQQLIVMARPEKTQLLANYPNPFNPETWIPYELATDTDVRITIYNAQGVVIRTLQLGQQAAGYYTDRERAAYWDGRNALGEQVASGIYFYQLETDTLSLMRKMVILK